MSSVSVWVRKTWPFDFQLRPLLGVVVEFAVEDGPDGAVLVRDRLLAVGEADDGEPAVGEVKAGAFEEPVLVRSAMDDGLGHRGHHPKRGRPLARQVDHPRDSAHSGRSSCHYSSSLGSISQASLAHGRYVAHRYGIVRAEFGTNIRPPATNARASLSQIHIAADSIAIERLIRRRRDERRHSSARRSSTASSRSTAPGRLCATHQAE